MNGNSLSDFKKAFDTVAHSAIWDALQQQGITTNYITLLGRLYSGQTGQVKTDALSREFDILRGTKQGDPLSSLLFNSVSESIFRKMQPIWSQRQCGLHLQAGTNNGSILTNLRFADDVLLFATSLPQLKTMIKELRDEAQRVGLELHPDKTKILHNIQRRKCMPEELSTDAVTTARKTIRERLNSKSRKQAHVTRRMSHVQHVSHRLPANYYCMRAGVARNSYTSSRTRACELGERLSISECAGEAAAFWQILHRLRRRSTGPSRAAFSVLRRWGHSQGAREREAGAPRT